ncbi:MAG: hypothetical protein IMZ50_02750 [Candidatus Atribacteria bacterium]|nr:hypothetical protein [Candidatus Atribacteria bacterium]
MIPTTFTFLTIDQWLEDNPDLKLEKDECMECDGTGEHHCDCGDEHECGVCDGTGIAEGDSFLNLYKRQLEQDISRLSKYYNRVIGEEANPIFTVLEETHKRLLKDIRFWRPKVYKQ